MLPDAMMMGMIRNMPTGELERFASDINPTPEMIKILISRIDEAYINGYSDGVAYQKTQPFIRVVDPTKN